MNISPIRVSGGWLRGPVFSRSGKNELGREDIVQKWGPVVADGVSFERKVLVRIVQCWILESSSYF